MPLHLSRGGRKAHSPRVPAAVGSLACACSRGASASVLTSDLGVTREACGRQLAGGPWSGAACDRASEAACSRPVSPGAVVHSPDPSCCRGRLHRGRLRSFRCRDRVPGGRPRHVRGDRERWPESERSVGLRGLPERGSERDLGPRDPDRPACGNGKSARRRRGPRDDCIAPCGTARDRRCSPR